MDGYRIEVSEQTIRRGLVTLIEPEITAEALVAWVRWVGYVRALPCSECQPVGKYEVQR